MFVFEQRCFRHYVSLSYNATTNEWVGTPGVKITIPKEGTMYAMEILDGETTGLIKYFHGLVEALKERGFQDGVNR